MYYFVYDLDETLAEVYSVFYFVMCFKLKKLVSKNFFDANLPMFDKLENAYRDFVKRVAELEKSDKPLGILRPGILDVMRELESLREQNKIHSIIIYSNNGNIENLEFVKDVIVEAIMAPNSEKMKLNNSISDGILIKELIHWGHPERNIEIPLYSNGRGIMFKKPGVAKKTWKVLHKIITKNETVNPDFMPENVFFFDDIITEHSIKTELGPNYYRVPKYDFKAPVERIAEIYKLAMEPLLEDDSFDVKLYIKKIQKAIFKKVANNARLPKFDDIVYGLKRITGVSTAINALVPRPDIGINMMMDAIMRVKAKTDAVTGGRRRTRKKKVRHMKHASSKKSKK